MTGDPTRLLHDPATAAVLRRDLGVAARGAPYDVAAGLARFEAGLAANLAPGTGVATAAKVGGGSGGVLAVGALLLVGGLAAAIGWSVAAPGPEAAYANSGLVGGPALRGAVEPEIDLPTPRMPAPEVSAVTPMLPMLPMPSVTSEIDAADAAVEPAVADSQPGKLARKTRGARNEVSPVRDAPADYLREARDLNAARGHLGHDPARALALAEAGAAEFAAGTFTQEWQGVAVLALFELGRGDEARARAESFLRRYPSGTYAPRIRQVLTAAP